MNAAAWWAIEDGLLLALMALLVGWAYQSFRQGKRPMGSVAAVSGLMVLVVLASGTRLGVASGRSMSPALASWNLMLLDVQAFRGYGAVKPGDVVVFASPQHGSAPEGQVLAKRVVALEGQQVRHNAGMVQVDGQPLLREPVGMRPPGWPPGSAWKQAWVGGQRIDVWAPLHASPVLAETLVPPSHAFLVGDHWRDSVDSRSFGVVPSKAIRGRVWATWSWEDGWKRL